MPVIAKVVVDLSLDRPFDYLVPPELEAQITVGTPVRVPFRNGEKQGFVIALTDRSEFRDLKCVRAAAGKQGMIRDRILALARWMAEYYAAPLENAVRTVLPGAVRARGAKFVERRTVRPTQRGLHPAEAENLRARAPLQAAALDALRAAPAAGLRLAELVERAGTSGAAVLALERKGLAAVTSEVAGRDPMAGVALLRTEPLPLMPQQAEALALIGRAVDTRSPPVVLLHGVTGSGKTEVYLQALAHARERGRGAIVLVPEIALTPQTVDRFRGRFGECVAVLHSHLSSGERHDEWHRLHEGRASIAIGARSALFAPVRDLGLIVVDEEHEPSYKQDEAPRYSARDVAVMRGHLEQCAVVLGSATPSLESWYNVQRGKYALARMPHRVDHRAMPLMKVIDMRAEAERDGRPSVFSKELLEALHERLAKGEQSILFLNRRGFASNLLCTKCGYVAKCEACSVSMVYHKRAQTLVCHLCGALRPLPARCPNPACGDPAFRFGGVGTERVEEILARLVPRARVARMDSDTMTDKNSYRRVLGEFRTGRLDILLGTQMIAKGLDFPNVTLVGILNADLALHLPDFRAGERTFQLLTQVAGRAGRGEVEGEVIVQTYTPFHPAVQAARRMDYEGFCDQELEARRELFYPPYSHLVCVTLRGPLEGDVQAAAARLAEAVRPRLGAAVQLSDPAPAPIARIQGLFRHQLMLRGPTARSLTAPLREAMRGFKWPADVAWTLDVDAVSLL